MNALLSFAPLLLRQRGRLIGTLALSLLTLVTGIALLGVSGWFVTAAGLSTAGAAFNLFGPSAGVRGLAFIRILSRYGEKIAGHDVTLRLLSEIRGWLFGRLFAAIPLPGAGLSRPDVVSRLVADVEALDNVFLTALGPITTAIGVGLAMSLGVATILPGAALGYAFCFFAVALLVPMALVAFSRQIGETVVVASAELRQQVLDGLDAHQDLVVFAQTGRAAERAATAATALASAKRRLGLLGAAANAVVQMLAGVATILVLITGISTLNAGRLDGPLLTGVLLAVIASFEAAAPLVRGATRLSAAAAAADRLKAMAEIESPIVEPRAPAELPLGGALELDHVRFGFDPSRPVLDDLSLSIGTGERVAIVGPSGAGKSTIAQLLVRLADPQSGAIRLNGVELSRLPLATLREHISLMTQEAPIFNDTIRNNLLIGSPHASTEALRQAIEAVELGDLVRKLPEGLDAVVGEAGATLSTGQARRLALARTLLSPAQILVLDEPTSGLDRATELTFFGNLRQAAAGRTVVLITHASLPEGVVDRIYPLNGGVLRSM